MPQHPIRVNCCVCNSEFQVGPDIYGGHNVDRYKISVCNNCWEANRDGWATVHENQLLAHLEAKGIAIPERNAKGWYPSRIGRALLAHKGDIGLDNG